MSGRLLHGDFGISIITMKPILNEFATLFPATIELSFCAMLFAICIGVPAGVIAAVRRGSAYDQSLMGLALTGYSMPIFWWGLLLIMLVSGYLGLTPVSGRIDPVKYYFRAGHRLHADRYPVRGPEGRLSRCGPPPHPADDRARHHPARRHRAHDALLDARGARGGLCPHRPRQGPVAVAASSASMRCATLSSRSSPPIGLQVTTLLAGAVLTETIFSWPGVGKWLIESIGRRDYPALQGGIMLISGIVIVVNLIVDLLYGLINPRIRHAR